MKVVQLIPGAGNNFYCENCLRDHGLSKALRALGHDALMVPLYLPIMTDTENKNKTMPVFFGGVNVYLQQKIKFFRQSPPWVDALFNHPRLLSWAAGLQGMTRPKDLAETTLSMLKGEDGHQAKELDKLIDWLQNTLQPDVVHISNALLLGMARPIKEALGVPVVCTLQDEDIFVDPLPEPYRQQVWDLMAAQVPHVDGFIAVSDYFAQFMAERMRIPQEKMHRVYNGIDLNGHDAVHPLPETPVIGFLERQCADKGLHTLVDAFIRLRSDKRFDDVRLRIAGGQTAEDARYVRQLKRKLHRAGLKDAVDFLPNLSREEKIDFLHSLTLLSVPARHAEAFGIYILDALAAGVPVVLPEHGAFAEIINATGGGALYAPHNAETLAATLAGLLRQPGKLVDMSLQGRQRVAQHFSIEEMARQFAAVLEKGISLDRVPRQSPMAEMQLDEKSTQRNTGIQSL